MRRKKFKNKFFSLDKLYEVSVKLKKMKVMYGKVITQRVFPAFISRNSSLLLGSF
jgi:hypothetical protein